MPKPDHYLNASVRIAGSGRLALILVLLLILLALAGAFFPQEGMLEPSDILKWQEEHSVLTTLVRPLGLFNVFHSIPFMATLVLLALNTLVCTLKSLFQPKSSFNWRKLKTFRVSGFLGLHISLLGLMAGGFYSGAVWMDGIIVFTEGQTLEEEAGSYVMLAKGPLKKKNHTGFKIRLEEVSALYDSENIFKEASAKLEFESLDGQTGAGTVRINYPVSFLDVDFTLKQTGFSPRFIIRKQGEQKPLINSFVALKTFEERSERDYRDFLALPFLDKTVYVRFFPDAEETRGGPVKIGDRPGNSLIQIWTESEGGIISEQEFIHPGETAGIAGLDFTYLEFRRWAGFRVVQDPGYAWVVGALWLGMASLVMRYIPDLKAWFSPHTAMIETTREEQENGIS